IYVTYFPTPLDPAAKTATGITALVPVLIAAFAAQFQPLASTVQTLARQFNAQPTSAVVHDIQAEINDVINKSIGLPSKKGNNDSQASSGQPAGQGDADAEKGSVKEAIRANKLKIIVFIDELDRCPLEKIVDILEAIKLFLAEDIFIVFLAVDTRVAAEGIR